MSIERQPKKQRGGAVGGGGSFSGPERRGASRGEGSAIVEASRHTKPSAGVLSSRVASLVITRVVALVTLDGSSAR
jgi:hypothetical protein